MCVHATISGRTPNTIYCSHKSHAHVKVKVDARDAIRHGHAKTRKLLALSRGANAIVVGTRVPRIRKAPPAARFCRVAYVFACVSLWAQSAPAMHSPARRKFSQSINVVNSLSPSLSHAERYYIVVVAAEHVTRMRHGFFFRAAAVAATAVRGNSASLYGLDDRGREIKK